MTRGLDGETVLLCRTGLHSEQDLEAFLSEVIVMRQNVSDAALAHDVHRDTIGQAVAFVGPGFVQRKPGHECVVVVKYDFCIWSREQRFHPCCRCSPSPLPVFREEVKQLDEDVVGRRESCILERGASRKRKPVPLIPRIEKGDPVQRVNEYYLHGCLLGAPYR